MFIEKFLGNSCYFFMKIIYIANIRLPTEKAHGIQIMKMCQAFANKGVEVELLVPRRRNDLKQDSFDFYNIEKTFRITRIPCLDFVSFDVANIGFLISTVSFLICSKIYLFFKKYDILYSREQLSGLFFRNFISEVHTLPKKIGYLRRRLLNRAKEIIVLTDFLKNALLRSGIGADKISVLPDAVDLEEFDIDVSKETAREKLKLPLNKKIILYTGSFFLYGWKGVDVLLESAKMLSGNYLFVLVGGHSWELNKIRKQYELKNVILVPYVHHAIIPFYLKSADILVIPNKSGDEISEKYTSPLKLFEYMASKRPIICSDLPSLREILTEKEALFFKPDSSGDLVRVLLGNIDNLALLQKTADYAFKKVQKYTWENRALQIKNIFAGLTAN